MSAAFGAGDVTASAGANNNNAGGGGNSAANVGEFLGNTISLDEIMRATKTNVRSSFFFSSFFLLCFVFFVVRLVLVLVVCVGLWVWGFV